MHYAMDSTRIPERIFRNGSQNSACLGGAAVEFDRNNDRVRCLFPKLVDSADSSHIEHMKSAQRSAKANNAGRISMRFFSPRDSIPKGFQNFERMETPDFEGYAKVREAAVPFRANGMDCVMTCLAMCRMDRMGSSNTSMLKTSSSHDQSGYYVRMAGSKDAAELAGLFRVFSKYAADLSEEGVGRTVASCPTMVSVERTSGRVVSALVAEHIAVQTAGLGSVNMVEIGYIATLPKHRRKGLMSAMMELTVERARKNLGENGLIITYEGYPGHPGPIRAAVNAGGKYGGYLNKPVVLGSDVIGDPDFKDLVLFYW